MARRRALLLPGSQAAGGRDRGRAGGDRPPRRPPGSGRLAAQVRAAQRPGGAGRGGGDGHSSVPCFLREGSFVGRCLEGTHLCVELKECSREF